MRYIRLIVMGFLIAFSASLLVPNMSFSGERITASASVVNKVKEEKGFFENLFDSIKEAITGWVKNLGEGIEKLASAPGIVLNTVKDVATDDKVLSERIRELEKKEAAKANFGSVDMAEPQPQGTAPAPDSGKTDFAGLNEQTSDRKEDKDVAKAEQPEEAKADNKKSPVVFIERAAAPTVTVDVPSSSLPSNRTTDIFRINDVARNESGAPVTAVQNVQPAVQGEVQQNVTSSSPDASPAQTVNVVQSTGSEASQQDSPVVSIGEVEAADVGESNVIAASEVDDTQQLNAGSGPGQEQTQEQASDNKDDVEITVASNAVSSAALVQAAALPLTQTIASSQISSALTQTQNNVKLKTSNTVVASQQLQTVVQQETATALQTSSLNVLPVGSAMPQNINIQTTDLPDVSVEEIAATISAVTNEAGTDIDISVAMFIVKDGENVPCAECEAELTMEKVDTTTNEKVVETLLKAVEGDAVSSSEGVMLWVINNYKLSEQAGDIQHVIHMKVKRNVEASFTFMHDEVIYITPVIDIKNLQELQDMGSQTIPDANQLQDVKKTKILVY